MLRLLDFNEEEDQEQQAIEIHTNYPYDFHEMFSGCICKKALDILITEGNLSEKAKSVIVRINESIENITEAGYFNLLQNEMLRYANIPAEQLTEIAQKCESLYGESPERPNWNIDEVDTFDSLSTLNDILSKAAEEWFFKAVQDFNQTEDKENTPLPDADGIEYSINQ